MGCGTSKKAVAATAEDESPSKLNPEALLEETTGGQKPESPQNSVSNDAAAATPADEVAREEEVAGSDKPPTEFVSPAAGPSLAQFSEKLAPQQSPLIAPVDPFTVDVLEGIDLSIPVGDSPAPLARGIVYTGQWKAGKQHGRGQQKQPNGIIYTGQFENGHIQGFGRLERPDGSKYEGEFKEGKAHTSTRDGIYVFKDGSKYVGQWDADKRHGHGIERMVDGSMYDGEYRRGSKSGFGKMKSAMGDLYEGFFLNGDMNGQGAYTWADGRVYDGQWSLSKMHGQGKFSFVDGRTYTGDFLNSKMEGRGVLTWPDGSSYDGEFKNGQPHGEGAYKADANDQPRMALWNQGIRVRWLQLT